MIADKGGAGRFGSVYTRDHYHFTLLWFGRRRFKPIGQGGRKEGRNRRTHPPSNDDANAWLSEALRLGHTSRVSQGVRAAKKGLRLPELEKEITP
jgi:hypothetical protein